MKGLVYGLLRLPEGLPQTPAGSYRSVEVFRASPRWLTYRYVQVALFGAIVLLGLAIATIAVAVAGEPAGAAVLALACFAGFVPLAVAVFCVRIEYELRTYIVTDRSLRVRQGAFIVEEMTLTYANVQNLSIEQGPVQRLFGIFDLHVQTAGGGASAGKHEGRGARAHTVILAGLEDPRAMREKLLAYVRAAQTGSGLGDPDDAQRPAAAAPSAAWTAALRDVQRAAAGLANAAREFRGLS